MKNINNIRTGRHCVFEMHCHLVFVTKYRKNVFSKEILHELNLVLNSVCNDFEVKLVEFNGESDHVHLLINYPPKISISSLVNSLKGVSSRMIRRKFKEIEQKLWKGKLWTPSYFASTCGGAPISILREYIESQNIPC